jgi:hypothetical protein
MCKELTIISIFLLGFLADVLWFGQTVELRLTFFLQLGLAIFLLTFIYFTGKKYLTKHFGLRPKFSPVSIWKFDRSGFRFGFWKRQTPLPRV